MALDMKIGICFVKIFENFRLKLRKVSKSIFEQMRYPFYIVITIICQFVSFWLQGQTCVELGDIPLLIQLRTPTKMHKIKKRLIHNSREFLQKDSKVKISFMY